MPLGLYVQLQNLGNQANYFTVGEDIKASASVSRLPLIILSAASVCVLFTLLCRQIASSLSVDQIV
jgi:hypothetical protein